MERLPGQVDCFFGGSFAAEAALVSAENDDKAKRLVSHQLTFEYRQNITRMYEVGTSFQYLLMGRAHGTASLGLLAGLRPKMFRFFKLCSDSLTGENEVIFEFSPIAGKENSSESGGIALSGMLVESVGFSFASGPVLSSEQVHASFVSARLE